MAIDSARMTRCVFSQLDDDFVALNKNLDKLEYSEEAIKEFRIFCDPQSAVEFFGYPKDTYKQIPIILVTEFPSRICLLIRSTEYLLEE